MKVEPEQAFIDRYNEGKPTLAPADALKRHRPMVYATLFERFKKSDLKKCLKCRQWFDDKSDMSKREPKWCRSCDTDHVDDNVKRLKEDGPEIWPEAKSHIEQGE